MTTVGQALSVPLALLAGAALASNPRIVPPELTLAGPRAAEPASPPPAPPPLRGKLGPESPELLALRLGEAQLFEESPITAIDELETLDTPRFDDPRLASDGPALDFLSGLHLPDLPITRHPHVEKYVNYFSSNSTGRGLFTTWLARSGRYRSVISAALAEQNLPKDLEALVFIESGMWPSAKSSAGAVGLWQFMPETARAYGLTVSAEYDERRSIWRSSQAAAKHLSDLYAHFKSWDLALAAYNLGAGNLTTRMSSVGESDFWSVAQMEGVLPEETRRYVPKVMAVAVLLNNLDTYGFDGVQLEDALSAVAFEVPPGTSLKALARAAGTSVAQIKTLNPELLTSVVPDRGSPIAVHIPRGGLARARVMLPRLLGGDVQELRVPDDYDWGSPDGQRAEPMRLGVPRDQAHDFGVAATPRGAARAAARPAPPEPAPAAPAAPAPAPRTPARQPEPFMSVEPPAPKAPLPMSSLPTTPSPDGAPLAVGSAVASAGTSSSESPLTVAFVPYRVQRGDTLAQIASRFGVTERELVLDNQIANRSVIYRGQVVQIRDTSRHPERARILYRVRPGDSLARIAQRLGTTPEKILAGNELTNPNLLQVGQLMLITPG